MSKDLTEIVAAHVSLTHLAHAVPSLVAAGLIAVTPLVLIYDVGTAADRPGKRICKRRALLCIALSAIVGISFLAIPSWYLAAG
jgi:hypothetical protein